MGPDYGDCGPSTVIERMSDTAQRLRPAVFLDRDGTIIKEKNYLSRPEEVELEPTAANSIARLNALGIAVIVVTNQAGIARGYFPESSIAEVHSKLDELLAEFGARIDRYEYCPHHPTEGLGDYRIDCACRKPKSGMLTRAAAALAVDLTRSLMIGDRPSDLEAGESAGCRFALVRTGYGSSVDITSNATSPLYHGTFANLAEAIDAWLTS